MEMKTEVFFDCETKKLFSDVERDDPGLLGVSIVSLYSRTLGDNLNEIEGKMESFWEADFDKMWPLFQNADRIVGFNSIGFDVPALKPYAKFPFEKLSHFDIMAKFKEIAGHRISLDTLSQETLDRTKSDNGLNAVLYWQKGDLESLSNLKKYCEDDVHITKEVYDFILKNKHALYKDKWNTLRKIDLDFTYPTTEHPNNQIGLF